MSSPLEQQRRANFFGRINERKIQLSGLSKLTVENYASWAPEIKNYLMANKLDDFLKPKPESIGSWALRHERLLGELIMSTVSEAFAETYLKEFKYRLFNDLWCEIERCCSPPVNQLKPVLNQLKSIRLRNCDGLKDYCDKYALLLDQIPIDLLNRNLHNLMSIFYGANVHFCCKRMAEKNTRLILPREKLIRGKADGQTGRQADRQAAYRPNRPASEHPNFAPAQQFGQTAFSARTAPVFGLFQSNVQSIQRNRQGNQYTHLQQSAGRPAYGFGRGKNVNSSNQQAKLLSTVSAVPGESAVRQANSDQIACENQCLKSTDKTPNCAAASESESRA